MPLNAQLGVVLYTASRAMNGSYRALLAPLGLTHTQYLVLLVLGMWPSVTVGDLGDRLQMSSGTLSPVLVRLEQAGLISRQRRRVDARAVEVRLTAAGARLRAGAADVPDVIAHASGMTPDEITGLRDTLQVLTMRLSAAELSRPT